MIRKQPNAKARNTADSGDGPLGADSFGSSRNRAQPPTSHGRFDRRASQYCLLDSHRLLDRLSAAPWMIGPGFLGEARPQATVGLTEAHT